jgi:anti-sigma factor RsiW
MACEEWGKQIEPYLDGERPEQDMRALDAHVRSCPSCASEVLARVQMKRAIQSAASRFKPDPAFRNRVEALVKGKPRKRPALGWQFVTAALVVILVAVMGGFFLRQRSRNTERVYAEIADLHVTTLASPNPVDVVSSDRHTVKPWFAGKIPFTFNLPELQDSPFSLVGGRVTYLDQAPGAELIYQIRQHRISVFIFPERFAPRSLPTTSSAERFESFGVLTWTQGGLRYFVIGDTSAADLQSLADLLKRA